MTDSSYVYCVHLMIYRGTSNLFLRRLLFCRRSHQPENVSLVATRKEHVAGMAERGWWRWRKEDSGGWSGGKRMVEVAAPDLKNGCDDSVPWFYLHDMSNLNLGYFQAQVLLPGWGLHLCRVGDSVLSYMVAMHNGFVVKLNCCHPSWKFYTSNRAHLM